MNRRVLLSLVVAIAAPAMFTQMPEAQANGTEAVEHRVVIHVDENDEKRMNLVLNNVSNIKSYYLEKGEEIEIEVVAYGPGLHMLRADTSPVKDRIVSILENFEGISFRACGNTTRKMSKKEGKEIPIIPQAKMVPSGVVHLIERQEEGWSYIRP